jgi:ribosome maturation factor RimP
LAPENLDRYALAARILEHLTPELAAEGYDLLDVRIFQGGGRWQTRLYVDLLGEERITLDGCAGASRSASMLLEASDLFPGPWVLEVSSPGIRRPLRRVEHFEAAVGRDVEVKWRPLSAPTSRPRNLRGRLEAVAEGQLTIAPVTGQGEAAAAGEAASTAPLSIPLAAVLEANLDRDFDVQAVIREDRRRRKDEKKARRGKRQGADGPQSELTADDERDGN